MTTFFRGFLKALRVGIEGSAAVMLAQLAGFFQGPAPSDLNPLVWSAVAFAAILGINFALGKLPKPPLP